jgi:hypothetical protein
MKDFDTLSRSSSPLKKKVKKIQNIPVKENTQTPVESDETIEKTKSL